MLLGVAIAGVVLWAPWAEKAPAMPIGVEAHSTTATSVVLRWIPPTKGARVDTFLVLRDGRQVGSVGGTQFSYVDTALAPGTTHRYTLVAASGKTRSDPSAVTAVTTLTPSPVGLRAASATTTSIVLRWTRPPNSPVPDRYVIGRNGTTAARVAGTKTSYADARLATATSFSYTVTAIWGSARSAPSAVLQARTLAPSPVGLRTERTTIDTVSIRWSPPPKSPVPDRYLISRDGTAVARVPGTKTSYADTHLAPATAFRYTVTAIWGGGPSAPSAALTAKTLVPPLSEARLQGTWTVHITITSNGGGTPAVGTKWSETWGIRPTCKSGACPVVVTGWLYDHKFTETLTPAGGEYTGSTTAQITYCGPTGQEVDVQNTVSLRLAPTKGGVRDGAWAASTWAGTVTIASPYTRAVGVWYCPSQSVVASLTANL